MMLITKAPSTTAWATCSAWPTCWCARMSGSSAATAGPTTSGSVGSTMCWPRGAVAKFAAKGKATPKKDLGMLAMAYGNVYVASVAMGADDQQTLKAFLEAEAYDGPALIIAYSHCIAHGIDMRKGLEQQKRAVQAGAWLLYRYNPALAAEGKNPLILDSKAPSVPLEQYAYNETRYRMLLQSDEARAEVLLREAQQDVKERWERYQQLAAHDA